jgi:hypothetical protein
MLAMNPDKHKKLIGYYHSLLEQTRFFNSLKGGTKIRGNQLRPLLMEFDLLKKDFPDIVPFDSEYDRLQDGAYYDYIAYRGYLSIVIGRLEAELDQPADIPVTEKRQFAFVINSDLRAIIERDYDEIQRAFISNCWKSVIILCGGIIEAILTDLLLSNKTIALTAKSAPKENDITRWDFSKLIEVSVELKLVSAGMQKLSHPLREYRNLVHPSNEIRNQLSFNAEEAKIAVELVHILHRDLTH